MSSSSSSDATVAPSGISYHQPMPYSVDSYQVTSTPGQSGGGNSGGNTGGGTGTPGTGSSGGLSDAAKAVQFSATCSLTDFVGAVVRTNGNPNVVTKLSSSDPYPAVGVIVSKQSQTQCTVQSFGLCINAYSDLRQNTRYFVGPNGNIVPAATAFNVGGYIQQIGFAVSASAFFVQPRGEVIQLAATRDADGNDTTPSPSNDGTELLYGGILTGTDAPAANYGRRGDEYLQYAASGDILLWGPKSDEEGWGAAGKSLVGTAGNRIYFRQGPPDGSITPNDGDIWFDTDTTTIYPADAA